MKSLSLDVWCLSTRAAKLVGSTPDPLSATSTSSEPLSLKRTSEGAGTWGEGAGGRSVRERGCGVRERGHGVRGQGDVV